MGSILYIILHYTILYQTNPDLGDLLFGSSRGSARYFILEILGSAVVPSDARVTCSEAPSKAKLFRFPDQRKIGRERERERERETEREGERDARTDTYTYASCDMYVHPSIYTCVEYFYIIRTYINV